MWDFIILIITLLVAIPSGIGSYLWKRYLGNQIVENWLGENGYELIESDYRLLQRGPFSLLGKQAVFRITVRIPGADVRSGWLGCGGHFLGLLSNRTEIIWDGKQDSKHLRL